MSKGVRIGPLIRRIQLNPWYNTIVVYDWRLRYLRTESIEPYSFSGVNHC